MSGLYLKGDEDSKTASIRASLMVALFLGELRDGLTMINMQNAFLITSKFYSEKQAGILFFVFGMSQFLFQAPAGLLMDHSEKKVQLLGIAAVGTTLFTLVTAAFAKENGANLSFMVLIKFFQGAITAIIPPALNSISLGIVGASGMVDQVSKNEMMNHLGTSIFVLSGSLLAFFLYPNIGLLFLVSPFACLGVIFFLFRIRQDDIDHDAARGLDSKSQSIKQAESFSELLSQHALRPTISSFSLDGHMSANFGLFSADSDLGNDHNHPSTRKEAITPTEIFYDSNLLVFVIICFSFHLSNATVLPLVMQTLAIENGRSGILLSGLCIIIAQGFMVLSAKLCGDHSAKYGHRFLFLIGLVTVPIRCLVLNFLLQVKEGGMEGLFLEVLILSTQVLDGIGAGVFGTMYVIVTSDLSGGTGHFSLILGITTAAMSIGGTISGYVGQALAQDIGYRKAFIILGFLSLFPVVLYYFLMPSNLKSPSSISCFRGKKEPATSAIHPVNSIIEIEIRDSKKGSNEGKEGREANFKYAELT